MHQLSSFPSAIIAQVFRHQGFTELCQLSGSPIDLDIRTVAQALSPCGVQQRLRFLQRSGYQFSHKYDWRLRQLLICARLTSSSPLEWEDWLHTPVQFGTFLRDAVIERVPPEPCVGYAAGDRLLGGTAVKKSVQIGPIRLSTMALTLPDSTLNQHVAELVRCCKLVKRIE